MLGSRMFRFFIVGLLVLLMSVPLVFVSVVINDRASYNRQAVYSVGQEWGGHQSLSGPVLIVPVQGPVKVKKTRKVWDEEARKHVEQTYEVEEIRRKASVFLLPDQLNIAGDAPVQMRHRGIFEVPVYSLKTNVKFDFNYAIVETVANPDETLLWDLSRIELRVGNNAGLRGESSLVSGGKSLPLEPLQLGRSGGQNGLQVATGDPRSLQAFDLRLDLNGAGSLNFMPAGRDNRISLDSDWPHPSFQGAFLPDSSDISEHGFEADWSIPHLARNLPQAGRDHPLDMAGSRYNFGLDFYQPNDFYQKAFRAARHGILYIALTFLTIFLIENRAGRKVSAVHYLLVGIAQSVFLLLMVAYAEQLGFDKAYGIAAAATVGLLTLYASSALKLGKSTSIVALVLGLIYGVMYLILKSADYAFLAGSTLAFVAVAATMFATRNEDWSFSLPKLKSAKPEAPTSPPQLNGS